MNGVDRSIEKKTERPIFKSRLYISRNRDKNITKNNDKRKNISKTNKPASVQPKGDDSDSEVVSLVAKFAAISERTLQENQEGGKEIHSEDEIQNISLFKENNISNMTESKENQDATFSRDEFIEDYKLLVHQKYILQKINILLQKNVHEYCKEKKLESYFEEEGEADPKTEAKYYRQLKHFHEFLTSEEIAHRNMNEELEQLQDETDDAEELQREYLEKFIEREKKVASGLLSEKNGRPLQEKELENLLLKQRITISELGNIRLNYIKLRDSVTSKETALKNLETFGEGLHLVDYEELKTENQNYINEIDQYDEEIVQLKSKVSSSLQSLTCMRKKAQKHNVKDIRKNIQDVQNEEKERKEQLRKHLFEKKKLHKQHQNLREEAGLLVYGHLIKDLEKSIEESQTLAAEIENLKNNYYVQSQKLVSAKNFTHDTRRRRTIQMLSR